MLFFLSIYDFCSSCGPQKNGSAVSVPKPGSCCYCSRQDNLKGHSISLPPTVIIKAPAVIPPLTMGKWAPSSTNLLSVIHTSKSSYDSWAPRLIFLVDGVFLGISFGSFHCCCRTHFLWSWHFVLVFHFFKSYLCVPMQTKVCPSHTAWSFCWAECRPSKSGWKDKTTPYTWWDLHQSFLQECDNPWKCTCLSTHHPNFDAPSLEICAHHCKHFRTFSAAW